MTSILSLERSVHCITWRTTVVHSKSCQRATSNNYITQMPWANSWDQKQQQHHGFSKFPVMFFFLEHVLRMIQDDGSFAEFLSRSDFKLDWCFSTLIVEFWQMLILVDVVSLPLDFPVWFFFPKTSPFSTSVLFFLTFCFPDVDLVRPTSWPSWAALPSGCVSCASSRRWTCRTPRTRRGKVDTRRKKPKCLKLQLSHC